jgi:hypothetical protein
VSNGHKNQQGKDKSNSGDEQKPAVNNPDKPEIIENLPPEIKRVMEFGLSMQRVSGPMPNPLLNKITPAHITTILDASDKEDQRNREERKGERNHDYRILVTVFVFALLVIGGLLYFNHPELVKFLITGAFGFAGGYGVGKYQKRPSED